MGLTSRFLGIAVLAAMIVAPAWAARSKPLPTRQIGFVHRPLSLNARYGDTLASANWAGYAVTNPNPATPSSFTGVSATWKEPASTCGEDDWESSAAFWVGIGGYNLNSQALEQIGTMADCNDVGPPSYLAWYELVPGPAISFAMKIEPGDTVSASVAISTTNQVTLTVKNLTRHTQAIAKLKDSAPDLSSAEWIAEAPTLCDIDDCGVTSLPNFGSVVMSKISATAAGGTSGTIDDSAWTATPIQIAATDGSTAGTCVPTGVTPTGDAFTVAWNSAPKPGC